MPITHVLPDVLLDLADDAEAAGDTSDGPQLARETAMRLWSERAWRDLGAA